MALTGKQQAFVTAYLDAGMKNAAAAYLKAYPTSAKWPASARANHADKLLRHADIMPIIAEARAKASEMLAITVDRYAVTKDRISQELARMAFADARRLFAWTSKGVTIIPSVDLSDDDAGAVVEVSHTVTAEGGTIRVRLGDKRAALMDLAKLHGHIVERKDVRLIRSIEDLQDEELTNLANSKDGQTDGTRH